MSHAWVAFCLLRVVPRARKFSDPVGKLPCLVGVFLRGPWAYIKFMKVLNPYRDRFQLTNHFFTGFFALSWLLLSSKSLEVKDGFLTGNLQKSAACSLSGTCQLLLPTTNVATSGTCHVVCKWNGTHMGPVVTDSDSGSEKVQRAGEKSMSSHFSSGLI